MKIGRFVNFIWDEFLHGGHIQALGAISIVISFSFLFSLPVSGWFLFLVCLIFYYTYLYNRFTEIETDRQTNIERIQHLRGCLNKIPVVLFFY